MGAAMMTQGSVELLATLEGGRDEFASWAREAMERGEAQMDEARLWFARAAEWQRSIDTLTGTTAKASHFDAAAAALRALADLPTTSKGAAEEMRSTATALPFMAPEMFGPRGRWLATELVELGCDRATADTAARVVMVAGGVL